MLQQVSLISLILNISFRFAFTPTISTAASGYTDQFMILYKELSLSEPQFLICKMRGLQAPEWPSYLWPDSMLCPRLRSSYPPSRPFLPLKRHLAMSGEISSCHNLGWGCKWHLRGRGQEYYYNAQGKPSQQVIMWPKMSIVPGSEIPFQTW